MIGDSKWIPVFIGKGEKKARKSLSSFFTPCPPAKAHEKALRLYPLGDLLTLAITGVTDLIGQSLKLISKLKGTLRSLSGKELACQCRR